MNDFLHFPKQLPTTFLRLKAFSHKADSKEEEEEEEKEEEEWHATKTQSGIQTWLWLKNTSSSLCHHNTLTSNMTQHKPVALKLL